MYSFAVEDVNQALQFGIEHLLHEGVEEQSRIGTVIAAPGPVCIEYLNPQARVLLSAARDANPFFHGMEALWMLAGAKDIEFPVFFNSTYGQFSDDGRTMWDAYGWRWRSFFGWDQLDGIVEELKKNPTSRRCVLSMWNASSSNEEMWTKRCSAPSDDIPILMSPGDSNDFYVATHSGLAVPCNTHAYFAVRGGRLNLTVMNRSNDAIWGCFGANAVQFSMLLEYVAMRVGVPLGSYFQFTNNLHVYTEKFSREKLEQIAYECNTLGRTPELGPALEPGFDEDLMVFMAWANAAIATGAVPHLPTLCTAFMQSVAQPMFMAWAYRKQHDYAASASAISEIQAPDWQRACREWAERREK